MNDQHCRGLKLNNKGLSLVELIIAISIGVIVSGSIAALITFSIRMYRNESVNTSMQYELQSNINMMMDEIMGGSVFVVEQYGGVDADNQNAGEPYTKYALFGNPYTDIKLEDGSSAKGFSGVIFVSATDDTDGDDDGKFKIYMNRIVKEEASREAAVADIEAIASAGYATVSGAFSDDPNPYLLGENLTQFVIIPDPNGTSFDASDLSYTNPIEVKAEIAFERNGWGTKKYNKHVDDVAYLRNKVTDSVFVDGVEYTIKKKDD